MACSNGTGILMRRLISISAIGIFCMLAMLLCIQFVNSCGPKIASASKDAARIVSHNVHYILSNKAEGRWSVGDWEKRHYALDSAFNAIDADIAAFQEMESCQRGNDRSVNLAHDYL